MDNKLRKNVRLRWFESLFELSHYEFQKKVWIDAGIENHVSDYSEAICKYFDDLDLCNGLLKFRDEGFITEIEAEIFIDFHNKLEEFVDDPEKSNFSNIMILQDSKWINLTNLAKDKWLKLKENLIQEEEINYISELENKFKQFL